MNRFGSISIQIAIVCRHGHSQQITSIGMAGEGGITKKDVYPKAETYPVENAVLEIDLYASRDVLDPVPMIDLTEVDANL